MQKQVKLYFTYLAKNLQLFNTKYLFVLHASKITKLQHKDSGFCHKTFSLLVWFGHKTDN